MIRFIIFCQARSGSTLLRRSLHEHPEIICHGEILSRKWINGLVPTDFPERVASPKHQVVQLLDSRNTCLEKFFDTHVWNFESKAIGFKVVLEDLFLSEHQNRIFTYLDSFAFKPIILFRQNQLKSFISRRLMAQQRITHSVDQGVIEKNIMADPISIAPGELKGFIRTQRTFLRDLKERYPDSLVMSYEHIKEDYPSLLEFIGATRQPMVEKTKKLQTRSTQSIVENIQSLEDIPHIIKPEDLHSIGK